VVRGNQPHLRILEEEWHKIEIQTGYKLEPVFQFDNSAVDEAPTKVKPGSPTMTLPQQLPNVSLLVPVESNAERAYPLPINDPQSQPQIRVLQWCNLSVGTVQNILDTSHIQ